MNDIKELRKIMPQAVITQTFNENHIKYECDLRWAKISEQEHDDLYKPIKLLFGERIMERYSHCTGHFDLFVRYEKDVTKLN